MTRFRPTVTVLTLKSTPILRMVENHATECNQQRLGVCGSRVSIRGAKLGRRSPEQGGPATDALPKSGPAPFARPSKPSHAGKWAWPARLSRGSLAVVKRVLSESQQDGRLSHASLPDEKQLDHVVEGIATGTGHAS